MVRISKTDPCKDILLSLAYCVRVGLAGRFVNSLEAESRKDSEIRGSEKLRELYRFLETKIRPLCEPWNSTSCTILEVIILSQLVDADDNEMLDQLLAYKPYAGLMKGQGKWEDVTIRDRIYGLPDKINSGELDADTSLAFLTMEINRFMTEQGIVC